MARQATPDLLGEPLPADDVDIVKLATGPQVISLDIAAVRLDGGTQPRAGIDQGVVDDYAADMANGAEFPPVQVVYDGTDYWLCDGFHRLHARRQAGQHTVPAIVRSGTRRDAVLLSVSANATHGFRRTNADKRRAVETLLRDSEWMTWSNREIARRCNVDDKTVAAMRSEILTAEIRSEERTYTTKHGTVATMDTANIGKREEPKRLEVWEIEKFVREYLATSLQPEHHIRLLEKFGLWEYRETVAQWMNRRTDNRPWRSRDLIQAGNNVLEQLRQKERRAVAVHVKIESHDEAMQQPDDTADEMAEVEQLVDAPSEKLTPWENPTQIGDVHIWNADSRNLTGETAIPLVDLVITSPPYNVGIEYSGHYDKMEQARYMELLENAFIGCHKLMRHGGRIAVVVPFGVGRNPWQPLSLFVAMMMQKVGFMLRGQIIWDKGSSGNRTTWGSFRSPSDPSLRDTCECIIVAHKSQSQANIPRDVFKTDDKGSHSPWLESSSYFMELAQDHWTVAPESAQKIGHPAPFPVELVKRLVHFYGWPTCTLLDPFAGSGTVGVAAAMLGCEAHMVDIDQKYCRMAVKRVRAQYAKEMANG